MEVTQRGHVVSTLKNRIATIEFYHPAHNSLPGKLLSELADAIHNAGANDAVKVVVLRSAGDRTFCAGASFDELMAVRDLAEGKAFFMGFANVINACRSCPKLIIGRVQGKAIGGGVGLAAAVDYSMATKYASVKLSELALGIGPFVVGPAVQRKIGLSAFSQMAINATEWQTAHWAKEKGLFTEVFDSTDQLDAYLTHFTEKLANMSYAAMGHLKRIFWDDCKDWDNLLTQRAEISGKLVLSEEAQSAIRRAKTKA